MAVAWNKGIELPPEMAARSAEARYASHSFRNTILLSPEDEHLRDAHWGDHKGYAAHQSHGPRLYLHNLILPVKPGYHVDHKNGIKTDNRRENLRYVSATQNQQNRALNANNKSGYKGVTWHKRKQKWSANIRISGKLKYLGDFSDPASAAQAYNQAAISYFGDYARPNEVPA